MDKPCDQIKNLGQNLYKKFIDHKHRLSPDEKAFLKLFRDP